MKYACICVGIIGALLLGGCSISNKSVDVPVQDAEKGNSPGLTRADSCEAYRAYLLSSLALEIARKSYVEWVDLFGDVVWHEIEGGWEGRQRRKYFSALYGVGVGAVMYGAGGVGLAGGTGTGLSGSGEFTQTNIQETGVDELDIIKTDGEYLFVLKGDGAGVAIVRAWPATSLGMVGHIPSRAEVLNNEADEKLKYSELGLFLSGSKLIVIGRTHENRSHKPRVYVDVYDISSPAAPKRIQEVWIEGEYDTARFVNGRIYLAIGHELQDDDDFDVYLDPLAWGWKVESTSDDEDNEDNELVNFEWVYSEWVYSAIRPDDDDFDAYANSVISVLDPLAWGWHVEPASDEEVQAKIAAALPAIQAHLSLKGIYENVLEDLPMLALQGTTQALMACEDIYLPKMSSRKRGLLSIIEISGNTFDEVRALGIADEGWEVYASQENFYAVSSSEAWVWWDEWRSLCEKKSDEEAWSDSEEEDGSDSEEESQSVCEKYDNYSSIHHSHIHRFELKGGDGHIRYGNSGEVEGVVGDPFWMSEHEGYLRVVSESDESNWWNGENNREGSRLSVLKIDGEGQMPVVGSVSGIAPGEEVYAARMFGDRGYVVTFKRIDPLFTLDLSVPESPKIMGELKINGYSSYIHPLGEDALLTIGEDGDDRGRILGIHLQIFDVSDMRDPRRIHQVLIERTPESYVSSEALNNHHAFTYHAPSGLLAVPMYIRRTGDSGENFSGVFVYRATKASGFEFLGQINHNDLMALGSKYWGTKLRRTLFMFRTAGVYDRDAYVYSISAEGVKVNDANAPSTEFGKVAFGAQE